MTQKKYLTQKYLTQYAPWCLILYLFLYAETVSAFYEQAITDEQVNALIDGWKPLEVFGDSIPWEIFAQTTETEECIIDEDGFDYCILKPGYSKDIQQYDGKEVALTGFMFPLDPSQKQRNFLVGPYPLSCPFHYHVGPSQVVEVFAEEPVDFSYQPVTIRGLLKLSFNEETGVFYYLENAKP
ncbi:MAG: DUF3299 domain-containing protein [Pseudomonadota bacterium]